MLYFLFSILLIWMIFPGRCKYFPKQKYYAHRGLYNEDQSIRENSLAAFKAALASGVGVELDVTLSQDQEVVVYHDASLERLFKRVQRVNQLSSEALKGLDIVRLEEVLKLFSNQQPLIIELKNHGNYQILCEKVAQILDTYQGEFMIESFDPRIVFWFRLNRPNFIRGQLLMSLKMYDNKIMGLFLISMLYNFLTRPHFMATHHTMKYRIFGWLMPFLGAKRVIWTIHENDDIDEMLVDGIIFEFYIP